MTGNNPSLGLVNMNAYIKCGEILSINLKILSRHELKVSTKGHNSCYNLQKMTGNSPNLDLVNMNAYTKFC